MSNSMVVRNYHDLNREIGRLQYELRKVEFLLSPREGAHLKKSISKPGATSLTTPNLPLVNWQSVTSRTTFRTAPTPPFA